MRREPRRAAASRIAMLLRLVIAVTLASAANLNAWAQVPTEDLVQAITEKRESVPEFREIKKMSEKQGLRVWLFGGTAAGFAHYVKWDLERQNGNTRFQADRFDYDFMNIYRSTQDLDIVVDGTPEQVKEFQDALRSRFPYFMGSKSQWEVRSLRYRIGDKDALLHNPDFRNQHTDSNSTGMIELTRSQEPVTRDLRDWTAERPQFLRDVAEDKLHYYFSDNHEETSRFQQGKNPPIFSVIRALTKAFQYELELRPEELSRMRAIIEAFDPAALEKGSYAAYWIEEHGKKLFRHAVDMQFAANRLDELGLLKKLISLSDPSTKDSLGWWLSKEPLRDATDPRSPKLSVQSGTTAGELGLTLVTHETSDFLAYESIRKSHKGVPNVFISRVNTIGETAVHGNGFYTRIGKEGAAGTGFHIRFKVAPEAQEGIDFFRPEGTDYVVWLTRDKLRVIQESLIFDPAAAIAFLIAKENKNERGIREMFKRKLSQLAANPKEFGRAAERALEGLISGGDAERALEVFDLFPNGQILRQNQKWTEWVERIYQALLAEMIIAGKQPNSNLSTPSLIEFLAKSFVLDHPKYVDWVTELLQGKAFDTNWNENNKYDFTWKLARHALRRGESAKRPSLKKYLPIWAEIVGLNPDYMDIFATDYLPFIQDPMRVEYWVDHLLAENTSSLNTAVSWAIAESEVAQRHSRFSEWMDALASRISNNFHAENTTFAKRLLFLPEALKHPHWEEWAKKALLSSTSAFEFMRALQDNPYPMDHPKFLSVIEHTLKNGGPQFRITSSEMIYYDEVLARPDIFFGIVPLFTEVEDNVDRLAEYLLSMDKVRQLDPVRLEKAIVALFNHRTKSMKNAPNLLSLIWRLERRYPNFPREKRERWIDSLVVHGQLDSHIDITRSKWVAESPRYADWLVAVNFTDTKEHAEGVLKRGATLYEIATLLTKYKWEEAPAVPGRLARALRDRIDAAKPSLPEADIIRFEKLIQKHHCEALLK